MDLIKADWDVPDHVHALTTTRDGGVSVGPYASLNLGDHVDDRASAVANNRDRLFQYLNLKTRPLWLSQVHGTNVVCAEDYQPQAEQNQKIQADGCYSCRPDIVCAVMTADCLPVALYNHEQNNIAVVHAGWKGLAAGIVSRGVQCLGSGRVSAWLGPAIGPDKFEVGNEVRETFVSNMPEHESAFLAHGTGKWLADIYQLARQQLGSLGVSQVTGGEFCTMTDSERFYSYRRSKVTGRMATLVWLDAHGVDEA